MRPRSQRFDTRDPKGYARYQKFMDKPVPPGYARIVYESNAETGPTCIVAFVQHTRRTAWRTGQEQTSARCGSSPLKTTRTR